MKIVDKLYELALTSFWGNPQADKNVVVKTCKLTNYRGAAGGVSLPFGYIDLPNTGRRYMLVELGDVLVSKLGINAMLYGWSAIRLLSTTYDIQVLCFSNGRMFSLAGAYILVQPNGNVLLALDYGYNQQVIAMDQDIYVRFYTNIFYSGHAPTITQQLKADTFICLNNSLANYLVFTGTVAALQAQTGIIPFIYLNGVFLPNGLPDYSTLTSQDVVDYFFDPFIDKVDIQPLLALDEYTSDLDAVNKVIFSVDTLDDNVYVDDTEWYLSGVTASGKRVGAYLPRISPTVIRMLTFRDWGLNSPMIQARLQDLQTYTAVNQPLTDVRVHLYRRNNAQAKAFVLDDHYLGDLMNLPTAVRKQVLTGVNSNLSRWKAATLEHCAFTTWMGTSMNAMTGLLNGVYSRYGALSYYETVQALPNNGGWVVPPVAQGIGGTLLSYGANGIGTTVTAYQSTDPLTIPYANGQGYEIFYPEFDTTSPLDIVSITNDATPITVPSDINIFCYWLQAGTLVPARLNVDYTLTDTINGTVVTWQSGLIQYERYVRLANRGMLFTLSNLGVADFEAGIDLYNGRTKAHDIGMGRALVWVNGHYMVEGLDYNVYQGKLYLCSKPDSYTVPATLLVAYYGLPDSTLAHVPSSNWGWVKYGRILENSQYDLVMYRNKRFFVAGRAMGFTDIHLQEHYQDKVDTTPTLTYKDGDPYAILDLPYFSRSDHLDTITPSMDVGVAVDKEVSSYLSSLDPQAPATGVIVIPNKYTLVSPFMNAVIDAVSTGAIAIANVSYSDDVVIGLCVPYDYLLHVDPCLQNQDINYTEIIPRWDGVPVSVSLNQYNFLTRVNQLILNNQVQALNTHLAII